MATVASIMTVAGVWLSTINDWLKTSLLAWANFFGGLGSISIADLEAVFRIAASGSAIAAGIYAAVYWRGKNRKENGHKKDKK